MNPPSRNLPPCVLNGRPWLSFTLHRRSFALSLVLLAVFACGKSTEIEPVVARVGNRTITAREFYYRTEFSDRPNVEGSETEQKFALLNLLVNEKLMALEAQKAGLDRSERLADLANFFEELAVCRELYAHEIRDKVELTEEEIKTAAMKRLESRAVAFVIIPDGQKAESYRKRLQGGEAFGTVLQDAYGLAADSTGHRVTLRWGDGEAAVDNAIYSLTVGGVSPVVETSRGYVIFKLEAIERSALLGPSEYASARRDAEEILRRRKEDQRSHIYVADLMQDKNVELDKKSFAVFSEGIISRIDFDEQNSNVIQQKLTPLGDAVIRSSEDFLETHRDDVLLRFKGGYWTVNDVLRRWRIVNPPLDLSSPTACRRSMVRFLSMMVRDKFLADEGYRQGYHKRMSVRQETQMWRDHYLCVLQKERLARESSNGGDIDWDVYLHGLRQDYSVNIDKARLEEIELTHVLFLAVRPSQYGTLAVPLWPTFGNATY